MSISPGLFDRQIRVDGLAEADIRLCLEVAGEDGQHPERRLVATLTVLAWADTQRWLIAEAMERHRQDVAGDLQRLQRKSRGRQLALLDLNAILRCLFLDWVEAKSNLDQIIRDNGPITAVGLIESQPQRLGRLREEPLLPLIDRRRGGLLAPQDLFPELARRITTWTAACHLFDDASRLFNQRFNPKTDPLVQKVQSLTRALGRLDVLALEALRELLAVECAEIYRDLARTHPLEAWRVAQEHLQNLHGELSERTLTLWQAQRLSLADRILSEPALMRRAMAEGLLEEVRMAALLVAPRSAGTTRRG